MPGAPVTLDAIRATADPDERCALVARYLDRLAEHDREARDLRDEAIRGLLDQGRGPTEVARRTGVSVNKVKDVQKAMGA